MKFYCELEKRDGVRTLVGEIIRKKFIKRTRVECPFFFLINYKIFVIYCACYEKEVKIENTVHYYVIKKM